MFSPALVAIAHIQAKWSSRLVPECTRLGSAMGYFTMEHIYMYLWVHKNHFWFTARKKLHQTDTDRRDGIAKFSFTKLIFLNMQILNLWIIKIKCDASSSQLITSQLQWVNYSMRDLIINTEIQISCDGFTSGIALNIILIVPHVDK